MNELEFRLAKVLGISDKTIAIPQKFKATLHGRIVGIGLGIICNRCGGSGNYSYNPRDGSMCYGCNGKGYVVPKITEELIAKAEQAVTEGKLFSYLESLKKAKQKPKYAIAKKDFVSRTHGRVITKEKKYLVKDYNYQRSENKYVIWIIDDYGYSSWYDVKSFELIYE